MKALRTILLMVLVILMANSLSVLSFGQDNVAIDKEKLADLIDSPRTKQLLARQFDGIPNINFDMDTMATDFFRKSIIVVTVDFEHIPTGKHGTASFAYRWMDMEFILLHYSHWWWGTVVPSSITTDTTWTSAGSPYYVRNWIWVQEGVTLTIEPGTLVRVAKTDEYGFEMDVEGTLNCNGATFTTSCDFENYDNSQVYSNDSDWWGIYLFGNGTCTIQNSVIEYANQAVWLSGGSTFAGNTIRRCSTALGLNEDNGPNVVEDNIIEDCENGIYCYYLTSSSTITGNTITMGTKWSGYAGIICYESSPVISSNTIGDFYYGIRCPNNSSPEVTFNTIQSCSYGISCYSGSSPVVHNNNIEGNYYYGLYNSDSLVTVDAENNWWGDATGPYNYTLNPGGLGDQVSDYVDFDPWLTSVVTVTLVSLISR